ncbi:MAG: ribonuclease III family protein [Prochlorococcaceae cyanobacterium]
MAGSISPQRLSQERQQQLLAFLARLGLDPQELTAPQEQPEANQERRARPALSEVLAPLEEALSHSSAGARVNHEKLEFLGDAVLRLAASEFLRREHPQLPVGRQAALRAQLVSDRWLAELGARCGIDQLWHLGATAAGDAAGRATVLAEISEALIGALYLAWGLGTGEPGRLEPVLRWLTPHWRLSSAAYLANPDLDNWKSALQEWSQGQGLGLPHYTCQERSQRHGDPERFCCHVSITNKHSRTQPVIQGEGLGHSRRAAQQAAARVALAQIRQTAERPKQL